MHRTESSDEAIHTWELYPHMVQWHQHHRQFTSKDSPGSPRVHINALLIMCSATMVEGAVSSLLLFYLEGPGSPFSQAVTFGDPVSEFHKRNRRELHAKVSRATWRDYKALFATITGESLPSMLRSEWSRLDFLFQFRNLLSHGESIRITGVWNPIEGLELADVKRTKEGLFGYLEKEGLVNKPKYGQPLGWSFLGDEIADHFVDTARRSVEKLARNVPDTNDEDTFPKRLINVLAMTERPDSSNKSILYSTKNMPNN